MLSASETTKFTRNLTNVTLSLVENDIKRLHWSREEIIVCLYLLSAMYFEKLILIVCEQRPVPELYILYELRHEKTNILHMRKTKTQISFMVTAKLICAFVFAIRIVQYLYFLNPKFQVSSDFL